MERTISFTGTGPSWPLIRARLVAKGFAPQMRMIDNMPAFPDEDPEEGWQELRVTLGHGMITLRRNGNTLGVIVWGNADEELQKDQEALVKACEESV
jgi:hypothetical protein